VSAVTLPQSPIKRAKEHPVRARAQLKQQVGEFNGHPRIVEFAAPGPHAAARDERTARLEMRQRGLFLLRWPA
jgi:hypothetical protein